MVTRCSELMGFRQFVVVVIGALLMIGAIIYIIDSAVNGQSVEQSLLLITVSFVAVLAVYQYQMHGMKITAWIGMDDHRHPTRRG